MHRPLGVAGGDQPGQLAGVRDLSRSAAAATTEPAPAETPGETETTLGPGRGGGRRREGRHLPRGALRRIARRRGKRRAIVAVGRSILVIVWHLLADPDTASMTWAPASTTPASARTAR